MYSSLDRIDIVAGDDDAPLFVQTDHRTAAEIESEPELSTIFALTKIIGPRRMNESATICYAPAAESLPAFFEDVLAAAGAVIQGMEVSEQRAPQRTGKDSTADLADRAFADLARRVRERDSLSPGEAGLTELEDRVGARELDSETDEIEYWTAVIELAAVTGELLRDEHGGSWVFDEPNAATIPFLFRCGQNWMNPTGKAQKFLATGDRERPSLLLVMARDRDAATGDGPVLVAFKPADWADEVVNTPLLEMDLPEAPPLPVVTLGRDYPNTFAYFRHDSEEAGTIDELRAEALSNLAEIEVEIDTVEVTDELTLWSISGSFFAAEKVLDRELMQRMHGEVGCELLAAAIPRKGLLLITAALTTPEVLAGFVRICEHEYESAGDGLYPLPLLLSEGKVVGLAVPDDGDSGSNGESNGHSEPGKKKSFWRKLFGR